MEYLASVMKNATNPNAVLDNLVRTNPRCAEAMAFANGFNGDYKSAFYAAAEKRGVDPDTVLSALR